MTLGSTRGRLLVRVKKTRQYKIMEPSSDSIEAKASHAACASLWMKAMAS
jgi:hypothetical protein